MYYFATEEDSHAMLHMAQISALNLIMTMESGSTQWSALNGGGMIGTSLHIDKAEYQNYIPSDCVHMKGT